MNLQFYLEKLHASESFKKFMKENPEAFLCSGFFVIDKEGTDNKRHFDFYVPGKKQMFSFQIEESCKMIPLEMFGEEKKVPKKLDSNLNFDFNEIERMIIDKMQQENIKNKVQKIIFSLQKLDGKNFLIGTVFISMLGLLKVNINLDEKQITEFEKKSFFDMMKVVRKKK